MAAFADICEKTFIIIRHSHPKKLTPLEELKQMKTRFISLREAIEQVRAKNPGMTQPQAAEWIFAKAITETDIVKHLFAGKTIPATKNGIMKHKALKGADWLNTYGFIRADLERALGMDLSASSLAICHQDNVYVEVIQNGESDNAAPLPTDVVDNSKLPANDENSIEWDMSVAGMKTALNLISGLAAALGKTSETYRRGGKLNISGLADCAERNLKQFGGGFSVSDRWVRKLLTDALKQCLPEIENEADQSEKTH